MASPVSDPNPHYRSLHLRVRADVADALLALAAHDSQRTDRRIFVAELHRASVRRYIDERTSNDPEAARVVSNALNGTRR